MQPLLDATGVAKNYGAVVALRNASLSLRPGEVHALMGANGAGKSTLVKILTGALKPTAGHIAIRGRGREGIGRRGQRARQRFGIMRRDDRPGEGGVGEVRAVGMGRWIGRVGNSAQREPVNDGRRRVRSRAARHRR